MLDVSRAFHWWLRLVPGGLHERLFALCVNRLLQGQSLASRLHELEGKRFRLCAHDVPFALTFEVSTGAVVRTILPPDVTFRACLSDFLALARRRVDPDTLFFQRRLCVEGAAETGLHLKNLLDGWEYDVPAHVRAVFPAPLADAALSVTAAARALDGLSRVRRPGSRRNIHPAGSPAAK
jgi:predicted lipid carrier protein YhbT